MRILVLANLYPPHHAGTHDFRCQNITETLRKRGHEIRVLTSNHGMNTEQRDEEIERRLRLNGVYGHPLLTRLGELKRLEAHNHKVLDETISAFRPDLVHAYSLSGLPKSFIYALRNTQLPVVYDVADHWLGMELRTDPWLSWWNQKPARPTRAVLRSGLELFGFRSRWDRLAPTRMVKGYDRLPDVYGSSEALAKVEPNSVAGFRFQRIYFCGRTIKQQAETAGFKVSHGDVIYPGIPMDRYVGSPKPQTAPVTKFLIVSALDTRSGVMTALQALVKAREHSVKASLSIYGRGDSEYVARLRSFTVQNQLPVEFLNVSNQVQDLPAVYRRHDALLYTAEWDEPFSMTPLEGMAAGLPVIGTAAGGVQELFRHGENALIYTPGDTVALAARIQELQTQPALRSQMVETAQLEVASKYNDSIVVDQIESYLETSIEVWQHN